MFGHVADWLGVIARRASAMARWAIDQLGGDGCDITPAVGGCLCVAVLLGFIALWALAEAAAHVAVPVPGL
jgi:hypothetical protein